MTSAAPRQDVLRRIADHLAAVRPGHPLRVGVDGITAAGKTTFADELAAQLGALGRPVVRLSMDGFHHPRAHRHRRGRTSADGYYEDAYDFAALADLVLRPAGEGAGTVRARIIDLDSDRAVETETVPLPTESILVIDGSCLQHRDVARLWDAVVFLDVAFDTALDRGTRRDAAAFGGRDAARQAYEQRYHAASRSYLEEYRPRDVADIVVDNGDLDAPVLRRIGTSAANVAAAPLVHRLRRWWARANVPVPTLVPFAALALALWLIAAVDPFRFTVALAVLGSVPPAVLLIRGAGAARRAGRDEVAPHPDPGP